jgi:hypothetical protein
VSPLWFDVIVNVPLPFDLTEAICELVNVCLVKNDPNSKLIGAEMLYPGFNLGIEDVSSWEWMRDGYAKWISNPKFISEFKVNQEPRIA